MDKEAAPAQEVQRQVDSLAISKQSLICTRFDLECAGGRAGRSLAPHRRLFLSFALSPKL